MLALLPYRRFAIASPLPPAELLSRISGCIERSRWAVFRTVHAPFRGTMDGSTFKLRRTILYGNGFAPVVVGRVEASPDGGSQLIGVMRLSYPTGGFMAIWFGALVFAGLPLSVALLRTPPFAWVDLIPEVMLVGGAALTLGGFLPETFIALRALRKLTDAYPKVAAPTHGHSIV